VYTYAIKSLIMPLTKEDITQIGKLLDAKLTPITEELIRLSAEVSEISKDLNSLSGRVGDLSAHLGYAEQRENEKIVKRKSKINGAKSLRA
jgi:hypothetical protein